jgi:hypothetical protein
LGVSLRQAVASKYVVQARGVQRSLLAEHDESRPILGATGLNGDRGQMFGADDAGLCRAVNHFNGFGDRLFD